MPPRQNPQILQQSQVNTYSIFYVHPCEGPNYVTVTPLLTGLNYLALSRSMQRALGAMNKLVSINGPIHIPNLDYLNGNAWQRCNHLIHSWIINSVSPQIAHTIVFHERAIDVWEELKEQYSKVYRICIATLRLAINNLKQGSMFVFEYLTEIMTLWEELNSHRSMPLYTFLHPCRCKVLRFARIHRLEVYYPARQHQNYISRRCARERGS